jgi:protein-S-isoprenylcysteine O-methyltransferase Ste14
MNRSTLALALMGTFLCVNLGIRSWTHWRSTGSTGFRGLSGRIGSPEWFGGALFVGSVVLGLAAPIAAFGRDRVEPTFSFSDGVAAALAAVGIIGTTWAQSTMGPSWRIGVRDEERTELVGRGLFRWVRNPIFSFMMLTAAGLAALLTNLLSISAFLCLSLAVELQVRLVEEPYLLRTHGERYAAYCRRVGRFVPRIGRNPAGNHRVNSI